MFRALLLLMLSWSALASPLAVGAPLKFVTQDFPPFSYLEQGRVAGPAAEIIRKVCKQMAVECEFELLPWRRALRNLRRGEYDGAFLIGWNESRSHWLHYSPPLIDTEYGIFVAADNPLEYRRPSDLSDYSIAVFGPSNTSNSLKRLASQVDNLKVIMWPDDDTGFQHLPAKRVDAVYSNRDVGWAMVKRLGLNQVRYAGPHRQLSYYIGFPKVHVTPAQVKAFAQAYQTLLDEGVIDQVLRPYGMKPAREEF